MGRTPLFTAQRMRFRGHRPRTIWCGRGGRLARCNPRRPSSGGRGVEDAAPYGLCVRVGVSIKPPLPVRRAALDAIVPHGRLRPRFPRRTRLASTAQRIQSRGHSPRTILYGRTHVIHHPTPGGRGSPPLRWDGVDGQRDCIAPTPSQPLSHAASRRDSSPFSGAEGMGGGGCPFAPAAHDSDASVSRLRFGSAYLTRRRVGGIIPSHDRERGRHFAASKAWPRFAGAGRGASAL